MRVALKTTQGGKKIKIKNIYDAILKNDKNIYINIRNKKDT